MKKLLFAFALIVLCFAGLVFAQAKKPKVLKYSAANYPSVARVVEATGEVVVAVKLDKEGTVVEAKAVSGHPLLREAGVISAENWTFSADQSAPPTREVSLFFNFRMVKKNYNNRVKVKFKKPYRMEITAGLPTLDFSARRR